MVYLAEDPDKRLVALKNIARLSWPNALQELIPRVKPDKQPLYRLGLKSF